MEPKRKPGRPKGIEHPNKVFTYLTDSELACLERLTQQVGGSRAAVIRQAVREKAARDLPPP